MPTTTKRSLRYPPGTGVTPDVARDLGYLTADLEAEIGLVAQRAVLDTGQVGQSRAGRQLTAQDFTDCGLGVPVGLWNLGDGQDASGNARHLTNKGSVPFGVGIEGAAASAAVFAGSTAQALYLADTGGADPFRIKTGTVAAWVRTAKRGTAQNVISKCGINTSTNSSYILSIDSNNVAQLYCSRDGGSTNIARSTGTTDIADDRWHFIVGTYDGQAARMYVDGQPEAVEFMVGGSGALFGSAEPFNIGGVDADGTQAAVSPHYGKIDEAFISEEVLSPEQVRHLYGVKLAHGMAVQPRRSSMRVTRRRRGAALTNADFPSNPSRAYNMAAGALTDLNGGAALTVGAGSAATVSGPDGQKDSALLLTGSAFLQASDTDLPSALNARSYGLWFNTSSIALQSIMGWATMAARILIDTNILVVESGADRAYGPYVSDGQWHHVVTVENNAPADGVKRKIYLDGVLVTTSLVLNSLTLAGATGLRIGSNNSGGQPFQGSVSRAFVSSNALSAEQVQALYQKSASPGLLKPSPKDAADNVEGMWENSLVFIGDDLEPQHLIDLEVSR